MKLCLWNIISLNHPLMVQNRFLFLIPKSGIDKDETVVEVEHVKRHVTYQHCSKDEIWSRKELLGIQVLKIFYHSYVSKCLNSVQTWSWLSVCRYLSITAEVSVLQKLLHSWEGSAAMCAADVIIFFLPWLLITNINIFYVVTILIILIFKHIVVIVEFEGVSQWGLRLTSFRFMPPPISEMF